MLSLSDSICRVNHVLYQPFSTDLAYDHRNMPSNLHFRIMACCYQREIDPSNQKSLTARTHRKLTLDMLLMQLKVSQPKLTPWINLALATTPSPAIKQIRLGATNAFLAQKSERVTGTC
jgi:hypothetical protein